jgi:glycosyltransferase involved in cell wall biosynthesis
MLKFGVDHKTDGMTTAEEPRFGKPLLAVLATHVIQYQVPLWRRIQERGVIDLHVGFLSADGASVYVDPGFGRPVQWSGDLLGGYRSSFLSSSSRAHVQRREVRRWVRSPEFDALMVHGYSDRRMRAALGAASPHAPAIMRGESAVDGSSRGVRKMVRNVLVSRSLRRCAAAVSIGSRNRDFYEHFGLRQDQIFDSPYAVDNDHFGATASLASARLRRNRPVILFCGKLIARKRPLDILDALELMDDPPYVVFCGDGELRGAIEARLIGDIGEVRGFVPQHELPSMYGEAAVLVLPSEFETWGLVVNEAMAAGCIPVTSDRVGCTPDLVTGVGESFEMGNPAELKAALDRVFSSDLDQRQRKARARVAEYGLDQAAEGIEKAVQSLQALR